MRSRPITYLLMPGGHDLPTEVNWCLSISHARVGGSKQNY